MDPEATVGGSTLVPKVLWRYESFPSTRVGSVMTFEGATFLSPHWKLARLSVMAEEELRPLVGANVTAAQAPL